MQKIILVGLGGFIGSVLRYGLSSLVNKITVRNMFYFSTLTVNIIGCFLIGALTRILEARVQLVPDHARLLLIVGLLGAFTTYSAFGHETLILFRENRQFLGVINVSAHIVLGFIAVAMGRWSGELFVR